MKILAGNFLSLVKEKKNLRIIYIAVFILDIEILIQINILIFHLQMGRCLT